MIAESVYFKGHLCFKAHWAGFDAIKPVNVVIGRNNSGKSHLLDLVEDLCNTEVDRGNLQWRRRYRGVLDEESLQRGFNHNRYWHYGRHLSNLPVVWEPDPRGEPKKWTIESLDDAFRNRHLHPSDRELIDRGVLVVLKSASHKLSNTIFRRLVADRDIQPEESSDNSVLERDGTGATNLMRRFIVSSNPSLPREIVQSEILRALNHVFGQDAHFREIQVQYHEKASASTSRDPWEIYLGEENKGLIPLSQSGSGLKTVLLVLMNLLAIPIVEGKPKSQFTFAFEELENNLHPALLRRLLQYIETYAVENDARVFLTTHSSTALDLFGVTDNAHITHVVHDGTSARTTAALAHIERLQVVSELGARPSDLLQANGVIWVEGPSDRIYFNHWIRIFTDGALREGRDYQCAFYGGALLARTQFITPDQERADLANLLQVNPNVVVVSDSDRTSATTRIKERVRRIRDEVRGLPRAHMWITAPTEIENYVPGSILWIVLKGRAGVFRDPERYEPFYLRLRAKRKSYVEETMNGGSIDKVELAGAVVGHMTKEHMVDRFDWNEQMGKVVRCIESWRG